MGLPVVLHDVTLPELSQEVLVMRDDYELEIGDISALVDDAVRRHVSADILTRPNEIRNRSLDEARSERINILGVERVGGLI